MYSMKPACKVHPNKLFCQLLFPAGCFGDSSQKKKKHTHTLTHTHTPAVSEFLKKLIKYNLGIVHLESTAGVVGFTCIRKKHSCVKKIMILLKISTDWLIFA